VSTALKTFQYRFIYKCIGGHTIVGKKTQVMNYSNIRIGDHCLILDNVYLRAGPQGKIEIGDYCAINSFAKLFGHGGILIEDYAQVGPNCLITTTTHNYDNYLDTHFLPVKIHKWAWIGAQSIILAGVTVGERSVIGAGSVVTKDVPPHTVVAGSPARLIRTIKTDKESSPDCEECNDDEDR
jgi:acetyltransferase-like isoleucine patch superfamily enzyme